MERMNDIKRAFFDVLDGATWRDIQHMTGMPEERCREIIEIRNRLEAEKEY